MLEKLYSVKMRAAQGGRHELGGKHVSGAERIVSHGDLSHTINILMDRAFNHSKGQADFISISLEEISLQKILRISPLPVTTLLVDDYRDGRHGVAQCLIALGLPYETAGSLLRILEEAPVLRGAMLIDINTLERLEPNLSRGVRVTGMDWSPGAYEQLHTVLDEAAINNQHIREALALASKVSQAPGIVAEICWSDDPCYTAGYVASNTLGYIRFNHLKPQGSAKGGRVFCFNSKLATKEDCIKWLENEVVLIDNAPSVSGEYLLKEVLKANLWSNLLHTLPS